MAITRAQQAKQMLQDGGRIEFQGGGRDAATESFAKSMGGQKFADKVGSQFGFQGEGPKDKFRSASQVRDEISRRTQEQKDKIAKEEKERVARVEAAEKARAKAQLSFADKFRILTLKNQIDQQRGLKPTIGGFTSIGNVLNPSMVDTMYRTDEETDQDLFEGVDFGMTGSDLEREKIIKDAITKAEDTGDITQKEFEDAFYRGKIYSLDKDGNITSKPKPRQIKTGSDADGGRSGSDPCLGPNPPAYCFIGERADDTMEVTPDPFTPNFRTMADGGRAELAEGGMPYEGGIMDLESARQMYGLGKLVKKVTRGVKKIAKSPLGKIAIGAALFKFGGPLFKEGGAFNKFFFAGKAPSFAALTTKGALTGIAGISALGGLTAEDDDNEEINEGADFRYPVDYYLSGQFPPNMRLAAEGGLMRAGYQEGSKEPVAKKTMPLLDMDGMEKDYREEGGFVPIGRMEKADDVPARLSKNEFVFTADAVRNAGDGDVDLGAEKMYNMMKNLEAGGDVSEESQGMDGARKMFQTSQRLEEVI